MFFLQGLGSSSIMENKFQNQHLSPTTSPPLHPTHMQAAYVCVRERERETTTESENMKDSEKKAS